VVIALAGCFLYNVFSIAEPWIRFGQAWTLGVICYLFGSKLQRGPRRIGTDEPCAHFLEREFEGKRRGFLEIRRGLFLFIPGIAATCWGGGPMVRAKALGLDHSSWLFRFGTGPWPLVMIGVVLAIVWLAFGKAAEKAKRDEQEIRRSLEL
jgi:H+/gluconate symporter-like permease